MADEIQYQHAAIQQGIDDMKRVTQQIRSQVDGLRQQTQRSQEYWESSSAESYNVLSNDITKDFENINQMLEQLSMAVGQGQTDMHDMDAKAAKNFQ
ncbi:hypothetical protein GCM10027271_03310 [Saccharopolyspora gloriosae]|uniref:ESAT-6-like protein n=1 Tax=Saccharopolyspora gloriosae TaxID=455344 RepID=A0A840NLD4_9PSEU|nr:WXG100 family type VII secretion target [Saccharopolyspora gloriosae]MBB5071881.1 WXG100 family type VII secretion target [Saccharopolyspora gloriosae]